MLLNKSESEDPEMKKSSIRFLSFLLAFLMVVQMSPVAFAVGMEEEEPADDIVIEEVIESETPEEAAEEAVEPEEAEEPAPEEEPEEAAEPEEETEEVTEPAENAVEVSFVFEAEYALTVTGEKGEVQAAAADETTALYQLVPGTYSYTAQVRGHIGTAEGTIEVTEGMEPVTVAVELEAYPYGLPGLALDAVVSEKNQSVKAFLVENDTPAQLSSMVPGVDYAENELIISAETQEEAEAAAAAYGAELTFFNGHFALVELSGNISVPNAVMVSMDDSLHLPIVEPNYLTHIDDPVNADPVYEVNEAAANAIYGASSWRTWADSVGSRVDKYLKNPSARNFDTSAANPSADYLYMMDRMNVYKAWGVVTGNPEVRLAIVDTGVASHTELNSSVKSKGYYSSFGTYVDGDGHGTHCAGIAAAAMGNGVGVAGIASGVSLYTYKGLDNNGSGSAASVAAGVYWAVDTARADVISMSIGFHFNPSELERAIRYAIESNVTVVCSMGNDGSNIRQFPSGYSIPGLIAVGSTDASNNRSPFSNFGTYCDVYAPGSDILSCGISGSNYVYKSGTSMSTPAVAGACALYMSKFGHHTVLPKDMEKMVKASKTDGILDVYKLVSKKYTPKYFGYSIMDGNADVSAQYDAATRLPQNLGISLNSEDMIVYTLDGTYPGFLNGELANGMVYDGTISLADFNVGDTVQINAAVTDGEGEMGEVMTLNFVVTKAMASETEPEPTETVAEPTETAPENEDLIIADPVEETDSEVKQEATSQGKIYAYFSNPSTNGGYYNTNNKNGSVNTIWLYSTQSPDYPYQYHTTVTLRDQYGSSVQLDRLTTTSKTVRINGKYVEAIGKTGSATIKAYDVYGRSTSFKVTVTNPVSRIDISPKNPTMDNVGNVLAVGKSTTHKITMGDAYGKPTTKKVWWIGELYYVYNRTKYSLGTIDNFYTKTNPYFSLSSSGKLTIKKALQYHPDFGYSDCAFFVDVYAEAQDFTGIVSNVVTYRIQMPVTFIGITDGYYLYKSYSETIYSPYGSSFYLDYEYGMNGTYYTINNAVTLTSSNPAVASVSYATDSNGYLIPNTLRVRAHKNGKATITMKANDGSGKTAKLKLTIKGIY